jgi:RNA polymerase sigma factor (sigma-70 family)
MHASATGGLSAHAIPLGARRGVTATATATESDAAIVARSLADPAAFATIFDRHWPKLYRFCTARAGAAGEDIAAETFRIAFDDRDRFDERHGQLRPWLFGIATNLLRHHFRSAERGQRARLRARASEIDFDADDALGRVEAASLGPALAAALNTLPAGDREALLLLAWAGLDYGEIALALDVPPGTVRSRIHRARSRVRDHLNREDHP